MGGWQRLGRPGAFSVRKHEIEKNYQDLYGSHRIVWTANDRTIDLSDALTFYDEAYTGYFSTHLDELQWITQNYADVIDNNPSNVHSGLDYTVQEFGGNHYQDIAIRRAAKKLGMPFRGQGLLEIRSKGAGARWSPGNLPFHRPDLIPKPEFPGWWKSGSIESYWQSAKYLDVKDPRIDLDSADLWFATSNEPKVVSARTGLGERWRIEQIPLHILEEQENVEKIAIHKAKVAYSSLCRPVIVDDSGFCIPSQDNWPGHHVARELKRKGLSYFRVLAKHGHAKSFWPEVTGYLDETLAKPLLFTHNVHGHLIFDIRGAHDKKYTPLAKHAKSSLMLIFIKDGNTKTVAEWTHEEYLVNKDDRWWGLRKYLESR